MRQGFTIVEMLTAVALLLLLVSIGYAVSFTYFQTQQLRAAADVTVAELRQARTEAFAQANDADHGIKVLSDHVIRFEGPSYASRDPTKDVRTDFARTFTVSGSDEFVFPVTSLQPETPGTLTLSFETVAIDILLTDYGSITQTERPIGG